MPATVGPGSLTLEEKCRLLAGADAWHTHAIDQAGIPALKMSDGPNGVRGAGSAADATPGVVLPVGIAQGASWDPDLAGRLGDLLGKEAVRKGAQVLLAPSVNLQRTPIGGRTFEYLSEDPELTARLAVALVRAVQAHDVAVTVKHFAGNDTEVDRFTVDVRIDERTRRELYLRPFEAAVGEAGAWGVMSAYNRLDGEFCAANAALLRDLLRDEWGFDGFVVSDWFGAHDTAPSATAGLSLEMPGPARVYGDHLVAAVKAGAVDEATVDGLVADLLRLLERTRAAERAGRPEESVDVPEERALCREAATAGTVLLRNEGGLLPLDPTAISSIALLGPNAARTRIMGGGSSAMAPLPHQSIRQALEARFGDALVHEPGVRIDRHTPLPPADQLVGPDGEPGLELTFADGDGTGPVTHTGRSADTQLRLFGSLPPGVHPDRCQVRLRGSFVAAVSGPHRLGMVVTGGARVVIGDQVLIDDPDHRLPRGNAFYGTGSVEVTATTELQAGQALPLAVDMEIRHGYGGFRLGIGQPDPPDLLERAVAAAAAADVAVVVVGTTDEWETEGEDRTTIALPGEQDELVRRVARANPRTVVVVNAGAPVAMPWIEEVGAVLVPFFGGLEVAGAVTDILVGDTDPGGRLPITFPCRLEDTPAWQHYAPVEGVQTYGEELLMGYRGFDAAGTEPLFPFGHGLSYGTAAWGAPTVDRSEVSAAGLRGGDVAVISVPVASTGTRPATVVVQAYLAAVDPPVTRPPKELKAFAKATLAPGEQTTMTLTLDATAFRRWDIEEHRWTIDPGDYDVVVAASAADERGRVRLTVT